MKFITKAEELAGKTIDRVIFVDCLEKIVKVFTDNTCAYIKSSSTYNGYEVSLVGDAKDYIKLEAGLISKEEYDLRNFIKALNAVRQDWENLKRERIKTLVGLCFDDEHAVIIKRFILD